MELILGGDPERKDLFSVIFYHVGRFPNYTKIPMLQLIKPQLTKN